MYKIVQNDCPSVALFVRCVHTHTAPAASQPYHAPKTESSCTTMTTAAPLFNAVVATAAGLRGQPVLDGVPRVIMPSPYFKGLHNQVNRLYKMVLTTWLLNATLVLPKFTTDMQSCVEQRGSSWANTSLGRSTALSCSSTQRRFSGVWRFSGVRFR